MPFGLGLHVLIALVCAVHVVRSGQQLYWLFILFAFPLLGSIVYAFAVWLPSSRMERRAFRAVGSAARVLDPGRAVREARHAVDETPTTQNQMRLAAALLDAGVADEAAQWYERCLQGPFATDLDIRLGAARAQFAAGRPEQALGHLQFIRGTNADFRAETVASLIARSYAAMQRHDEATAEFESALARFGTFELRADYAIFARASGDRATADRLDAEIEQIQRRWNAHAREMNADAVRRWRSAGAIGR